MTVFKHRFTFMQKTFSLAFMRNDFLVPLQMGSCLASVYQVLYSVIIHVSLYVTLFYLLQQSERVCYQTGNCYCCPVILSLNMKYE